MKNIITVLGLASIFILTSFKAKEEVYKVDTQRSSIAWTAKKVTGQHNGTIKLSEGQLVLNGNTVKKGSFIIDMNSMEILDLQGDNNQKLLGHLRSDDFFSVSRNTTSQFVITKVTAAGADRINITGNLTIKGITQSLTFPASVKKQGDAVVAVAKGVAVDRTKYDIKYRSKNFFGNLGDKAIDDEFTLDINLVAKK